MSETHQFILAVVGIGCGTAVVLFLIYAWMRVLLDG